VDPEVVKSLQLKKQQEEFQKLDIKSYEVPKEDIQVYKLAKAIK
jgi:hypothetical protein